MADAGQSAVTAQSTGAYQRPGLGSLLPGGPGQSGALVLGVLLIGGGSGFGSAKIFGQPDEIAQQVSELKTEDVVIKSRLATQERDIDDLSEVVTTVAARQDEDRRTAYRQQLVTIRWIAEVLAKQTAAIGAIASRLKVEVDLEMPPLLPMPEEPEP